MFSLELAGRSIRDIVIICENQGMEEVIKLPSDVLEVFRKLEEAYKKACSEDELATDSFAAVLGALAIMGFETLNGLTLVVEDINNKPNYSQNQN
jgi:hypothetical protein